MKKLYTILLFAAVVCVGAMAPSCSKDDSVGGKTPQFTLLELDLSTAFTRATSDTQGNTIEDVTVWAYEITGTGNSLQVQNGGKPVGWATKSYDTAQTTSSNKMRMELPYSADNKTYRLFAVVNKHKFGTIYTPMKNGSQTAITTLSSMVTYDELSTYVFEATEALAAAPEATQTLPVSHWTDVTINGGTTADWSSPYQISMDVYRALGKASLVASMDANSSVGAMLKITGVQIGARTSGYTVAQQGFMFADAADVNSLTSPTAFGTIQDIKRGDYTTAILTPADVTLTKSDASTYTTDKFIAAKFLYENHHAGATGVITDANSAGDGQYYMVINYEYGTSADFAASTQKSATGYVALPAIVRNHNALVDATFKIDLQGIATLTCTVADWTQDDTPYGDDGDTQGNVNLDFNYPTYSVMAYDAGKAVEDAKYSERPTVKSDGSTTFTLLFQMSASATNIKWKPLLSNATDYKVKVYTATIDASTKAVTIGTENLFGTDTGQYTAFDDSSQWYAVQVSAVSASSDPTELRIIYNAPWLGSSVYESMLINGTSSATMWPNTSNNPHLIEIGQE